MTAVLTCLVAGTLVWLMAAGVAQAQPSPSSTPSLSPQSPQVGQAVTLTPGTYTDATTVTVTDVWYLCAPTCIQMATQPTGNSYTPTAADVGATIQVSETASATDGTTSPAIATTAAILPLAPVASTPAPSIGGIAQQGQTLSLTHGGWTNSPTSYTDQWQSCLNGVCANVGTANSLTYLVAPTDVGHTIQVVETASNAGGPSATSETSAPTATVLPPVVANAAPPRISGTPQQGQTLAVTQGAWTNGPTSITDQWEDCLGAACSPIPGQTGPTYTLGAGDVGHTIGVLETAANAAGPGAPAASGRTGLVTATSATSVVAFSANAPTANQTVTLVATVASNSSNADPSGSLSFLNGSAPIKGCTGMGVSGGQTNTLVCQAAFGAGTARISAVYVPGPGALVIGSSSAPTSVNVGKDSTSVSLAVTTKVGRGKRATYSATLVLPVSNSGPSAPTGSISFLDRGQVIPACANRAMSNLTAACSVKYRARGTHEISAVYSGDANFAGSASSARLVRVLKTAPAAPAFVKSTLQWTFFYHPTYTSVILFKAFQLVKGTKIAFRCFGHGCPFHVLVVPDPRGGSINLLSVFRHRHLRAGTRFTVRLTHKRWVGKYYSFTIRGGRPPVTGQSCLAPGRSTPGVGC